MPQAQVHATSQPGADRASRTAADDDVDQAVADAIERAAADQETLDTTDALLDEIDAILTEEEEFAVNYRQKGGQAVRVFLDTVARGFVAATWRFPWADQRLI